ncbi:Polypyrimidine tract-binding protein 1 [Schistosoma japonicum]|nr:Polypyrimidine tract-binding protein 1 [Schistosoma japonicum]KAH8864086.1 Polypyrimidine tract-binding protein 1 [Schistosoma japonicum]KAH8864087.1 Polypyrimidine tract-binding protein 1 [Schistosoma japonicum]CAX71006.1 Regulator of differentiation 1 [Schistosoma japonicum]
MNGNGHAPMETDTNENKKSRIEYVETVPSKVVHIRNMPDDATEHEIALLGIPFGLLENMVLSKKANQALLEMQCLESAIMMVSYYREYQVTLRGRTLVMQYSKHQHLELHSENTSIGNAIQNANCIVQQDLSGANSGMPTTVLRVVVDNIMGQQINHTILHKIFYRYGKILRIVTYLKNNQYHGLVEFGNHIHAFVAMLHLNGQNIYTGCCSLRVQFSKNRGPLEVRQESEKCRDYLNNPLTEEELLSLRRPTAGGGHHNNNPGHNSSNFQNSVVPNMTHQGIHLPVGMIAPPNANNMGINELTAQLAALAQQSGLALTPAAAAATASFMALTSQTSGPGTQSMSGTPNLSAILAALQGGAVQTGVLPHISGGNAGVMGSVQSPVSTHVTPVGVRPPPNNNGSTVLIVSNLNEDRVYPDALFTLFGVYGDVTRVKIMFNKKDTALIQFTDPHQALTALQFLNGQRLWDKPMKIAVSRHNIVQLPKEDTENGLTKDYTNSLLHRFRKPNSKNFQNIYPPSHVLHLSNIPPSVTENDIRVLFATKGFEVTGFRFMKDNKMALVQLETVDLAIQSLIELHNSQLTENSHLRISFSKSAV